MKYAQALNSALQEIGGESRWCLWKFEPRKDKPTKLVKVPKNPQTGGNAMSNEPSTWADFDTAYIARGNFGADGFGFFLGGGYAGIDIDDCIDDEGKLSDMAAKIIERMNTYTETSPRGHGVHILFKVSENFTMGGEDRVISHDLGLEIYGARQYLTVTGHVYGAVKPIAFRENELLEIYHEYFLTRRENEAKKRSVNSSEGVKFERATPNETDAELWERMFDSQKGVNIRALYNGDISGYDNDDSRADLALCCYLAYWTGHDAGRIDAMFRQSGLMRQKWDDLRGDTTYGALTIEKAMADTPRYTPPYNTRSVSDWKYQGGGFNEDNDVGHDDNSSEASQETEETQYHSVLTYLEKFLESDLERVKKYRMRKIGYSNIDKYNSLFPGLYVVGSVTGIGKTTFCGQIADYLAGAGEHVLYFSLEQTELELVTKGLSRLTAQEVLKTYGEDALTKYTNTDAVSAIGIRGGRITPIVKRAIETYKTFAGRLRVIECRFDITADKIIQTVCDFVNKHDGVRPIVFVDYLQIVKPSNSKLAKRDAVDDTVQRFKKFSAEANITIFLISSLNRQNYLSVVDFESFKESGMIEYTADVVWGLQLLCMNATVFDTEKNLQTKRKFVHEAKNESPRKIELAGLKNRYGRSNTRYFFDYYAKYDLFIPYEREAEEIDAEVENEYKDFKARYESEEAKGSSKKTKKNRLG